MKKISQAVGWGAAGIAAISAWSLLGQDPKPKQSEFQSTDSHLSRKLDAGELPEPNSRMARIIQSNTQTMVERAIEITESPADNKETKPKDPAEQLLVQLHGDIKKKSIRIKRNFQSITSILDENQLHGDITSHHLESSADICISALFQNGTDDLQENYYYFYTLKKAFINALNDFQSQVDGALNRGYIDEKVHKQLVTYAALIRSELFNAEHNVTIGYLAAQ